MDVIGFLCVSLRSSTVQLHYSLGSRRTCTCSEAGLNSQNGDHAWGIYYRREEFFVRFCRQKDTMQRIFINKCFPFRTESVCRVKRFTTGLWNSQGRSEVSDDAWTVLPAETVTEATVQQLLFPWFNIQHNAWSFEVSESVRMVGAQRTEGLRKNYPNGSVLATSLTAYRWRRRYA
jgi:hypothetical protein